MPLTRRRTAKPAARGRKGNLRNGVVLALSQVAKVVNWPLAQDVARHVKEAMVALKPSVLQAPKANDSSAKDLEDHVAGLLNVLDIAIPLLSRNEELDRLCDLLRDAHAELVRIQASQYTEKLASQAQIHDRIMQLKEAMARAIVDTTLRLLLITLAGSMRDRQRTRKAIMRANKATVQTRRAVARHQSALVRAEKHLARSSQRIEVLERMCKHLRYQETVNEATYMRYTDGQIEFYKVEALNVTLFFFNLDLMSEFEFPSFRSPVIKT